MSDEAAFLDALKANPADDTARLVYADWLDEHDEPLKAEYLRAVVELASELRQDTSSTPDVTRLNALAELLPAEWRAVTAARFELVLVSFDPMRKINAIKLVREMTGMGLGEAKAFVERTPGRFPLRFTPEGAAGLRLHFDYGQLCLGADLTDLSDSKPTAGTFAVHASLQANYLNWRDDYVDHPPEASEAFAKFILGAGVSPERAASSAEDAFITVADGLSYSQAQTELNRLRVLLPILPPDCSWEIVLHSNSQLPSIR